MSPTSQYASRQYRGNIVEIVKDCDFEPHDSSLMFRSIAGSGTFSADFSKPSSDRIEEQMWQAMENRWSTRKDPSLELQTLTISDTFPLEAATAEWYRCLSLFFRKSGDVIIEDPLAKRAALFCSSSPHTIAPRFVRADKRFESVAASLKEIEFECREAGWDGEDALPVSRRAIERVLEFVSLLQADTAVPEVVPEKRATIGLQWENSTGTSVLVIRLGDRKKLVFAASYEDGFKLNGEVVFKNEIPPVLQLLIHRFAAKP